MPKVKNISDGPRGAYNEGQLVMAERGEVIEADDFAEEWFAKEGSKAAREADEVAEEAEAAPEPAPAKK
jgi:hypothetical protein